MSGTSRDRGAALVITLIFVTAMAAMAVAFLAGRRTDALTLRGQLQSVEAEAMLDAALQQTAVLLANKKPQQRVPDQLSWRFGDVAVRVRLEQETSKVDLNQAQDPMLRALPMALGMNAEQAAALADAIQDWRDDNHLKLKSGAEDSDYRDSAEGVSGAADRPLANPAELLYLHGIDRRFWALLQPYVTIYSGTAEPDSASAAMPVRKAIQIARGLTPDEAKKHDEAGAKAEPDKEAGPGYFDSGTSESGAEAGKLEGDAAQPSSLSQRETPAQRRSGGDDAESAAAATENGAAANDAGGEEAGARTVLLDVLFPNGYEAAARAVIALSADRSAGPPYIVMSWTPVLRAE